MHLYFCHKRSLVKRTCYFLLALILGSSCGNVKSEKKNDNESSFVYTIPEPAAISDKEKARYEAMLESFFDSALFRRGFNGGVLVAKEGQILYEQYVGYRDLRTKDPLTDTTSLHLASTSKPFTGMAVLKLVQDGKVSLDDSLTKFFPELAHYPGITLRMLLSHRSGLPNYVYFMADKTKWDQNVYVTNEDMFKFLVNEKPARSFTPGSRFSYSNTNYVLLAMLIEKVSGMSYPEFMKKELFEPMQLNHTYVFTLKDSSTATPSFDPNGGFWKNDFLEGTYGDKNIYSTPRDLLRWDQVLYTGKFIRQSLLDSAFIGQSRERNSLHNYGLGWRLLEYPNGKKIVYHFGRWHGFTPAFARLIDEKVTIIILGNKFNRSIYQAAHKAYGLFGAYDGRTGGEDQESSTESTPPPPRPAKTKESPKKKEPAKKAVRRKG